MNANVCKKMTLRLLERFDAACLAEAQEFVDCIRSSRRPLVTVQDGTRATEVAFAATRSFREDELVRLGGEYARSVGSKEERMKVGLIAAGRIGEIQGLP